MSENSAFTRYDDGLGYTMDLIFGLKFSGRVSNKGIGGHTLSDGWFGGAGDMQGLVGHSTRWGRLRIGKT